MPEECRHQVCKIVVEEYGEDEEIDGVIECIECRDIIDGYF
jgi:hypothetical protein